MNYVQQIVLALIIFVTVTEKSWSFIHNFIVLKNDQGKIVFLMGDQHALGSREQNDQQLQFFHDKILSYLASKQVSSQILLESTHSATNVFKHVFLDGSYNKKDLFYNIVKNYEKDETGNDRIRATTFHIARSGVIMTDKENDPKAPYTTWIFDHFTDILSTISNASTVEVIGCDSRYLRGISSIYLSNKKQGIETSTYLDYLKGGIHAPMLKKKIYQKLESNKEIISPELEAELKKLEDLYSNCSAAKFINQLEEQDETPESINKREEEVTEKIISDITMLEAPFDHSILLESCHNKTPSLTIVPAGSSHTLNVSKIMYEKLGYKVYYYSDYPEGFWLDQTGELNPEHINAFNKHFQDSWDVVEKLFISL
ncbi:MAG: hypothetical protein HQK52_23950 [Oligoflexia bacterium]|nr:hypothetical protein [Oligoflexia bacterium]